MVPRIDYSDLSRLSLPNRLQPLVDVVIINSRGHKDPGAAWLQQAVGSVREQSYPNIGLFTVDNTDNALTIGKAWNLVAKQSLAKYIMPLGDDDYLALDVIASQVAYIEHYLMQPAGKNLVHCTTACMAVSAQGETLALIPNHHTGMFLRSWLVRNPFNAKLKKFVDTEMHRRLLAFEQSKGYKHSCVLGHHYGYAYRQHGGMISGEKVKVQQPQSAMRVAN